MDGIFCVYAPPQQQLVKLAGVAQSIEYLTAERVAGSIPGVGPMLRVLTEKGRYYLCPANG